MSKSKVTRLGLVGVVAAVVLAAATPAGANADQTPPVLRVSAAPAFVVGSTIGPSDLRDADERNDFTESIRQRLTWSATDASSICGYDLVQVFSGFAPTYVLERSPATSYAYVDDDYDGRFGGESFEFSWTVTAHDCAGNATTKAIPARPTVTQDDGRGLGGFVALPVTYAGAWKVSTCSCWSGGTTRWSTVKGASATVEKTYAAPGNLALVMAKGPDRGKAQVYVDGVLRRTVDTYSAAGANRVVVFQTAVAAGTHRVKVVNLATPGHPRIDLDAVLTSGGH